MTPAVVDSLPLAELETVADAVFCNCDKGRRLRVLTLHKARSWQGFVENTQRQNVENSTKRKTDLFEAGVPAIFRGVTLNGLHEKSRMENGTVDPDKKLALNAARYMYEKGFVMAHDGVTKKRSLLLWGVTSGVGKTSALVAIFEKWQRDGRDCLFIPFARLLEQVRRGYKDELWYERLERARTVDVLFVDDLGAPDRDASDHVREVALELFRHRQGENMQTLITSNLSHDGMASQLGEYLYRRVAQMALIVRMEGKVIGTLG